MKDKLILKDGTEIELESGTSLGDIHVLFPDMEAMVNAWAGMTVENLSEVTIKNGDGLTVGNYTDLVLDSETSTMWKDGKILTSFHLREKTEVEKRLDALEEGQEVQDGAIMDLGEAVNTLS